MQVEEPVQANSLQTVYVEVPTSELFFDATRLPEVEISEELYSIDYYVNKQLRELGNNVFVYSIQPLKMGVLITYSRR
ncbi:hypothetical protein D3C74_402540 [compost metagenome]